MLRLCASVSRPLQFRTENESRSSGTNGCRNSDVMSGFIIKMMVSNKTKFKMCLPTPFKSANFKGRRGDVASGVDLITSGNHDTYLQCLASHSFSSSGMNVESRSYLLRCCTSKKYQKEQKRIYLYFSYQTEACKIFQLRRLK